MNTKILFSVNQREVVTPEEALKAVMLGLEALIKDGAIEGLIDDILVNYEFQPDTGYAIAEIKEGSLIDSSKLNENKAAQVFEVPVAVDSDLVDLSDADKTFSMSTLQERMRMLKHNPKVRLRYLVMDYKRYWKAKKGVLEKDQKQANDLKNLFLTDMTGLMTEVLPYLIDGKQLGTLIGTSQITPALTTKARELSLIYRKALKANQSQGQIPKGIFSQLKKSYNEFMTTLLLNVFPGIDSILAPAQTEVKKAASRTYSYTEDGRINLFD